MYSMSDIWRSSGYDPVSRLTLPDYDTEPGLDIVLSNSAFAETYQPPRRMTSVTPLNAPHIVPSASVSHPSTADFTTDIDHLCLLFSPILTVTSLLGPLVNPTSPTTIGAVAQEKAKAQPQRSSSDVKFTKPPPSALITPSKSTNMIVKPSNSVKLLAESWNFSFLDESQKRHIEKKWPVVKITNIPWSISMDEVNSLLAGIAAPDPHVVSQNVHILLNKSTGKTLSEAYVELASEQDVCQAVALTRRTIRGRRVFIHASSQDELLTALFSQWPGTFKNGKAIISSDTMLPPPFTARHELESLASVCRNYKLCFSRKCGERPFEHFISLMTKLPVDQFHAVTTLQRDHLYEYYKKATGILKSHMAKPTNHLHPTLLERMVRAALQFPGYTVPQKKGILTASGLQCPHDLVHVLKPVLKDPSLT